MALPVKLHGFNDRLVRRVYESQQKIASLITNESGLKAPFCPFTIQMGAINSTETGYKQMNSIPNDYTAFNKVFTGQEGILAIWDGCFDYEKVEDTTDPLNDAKNYIKKTYKTGKVFNGIIQTNQLGIQFSPSSQNNSFIGEEIVKNVSVVVKNDATNADIFTDTNNHLFKFYSLPTINPFIATKTAQKPGILFSNTDKQWYFITAITIVYELDVVEPACAIINFLSVNDKLAKTGQAMNQYIQVSPPGGKYCLPAIANDGTITFQCSQVPVNAAQVMFYGIAGVNNIGFFGRPVYNTDVLDDNIERVYAPRRIFPFKPQCSASDELSGRGLASTNFYCAQNYGATLDSYVDWKQSIATSYNDNAVKVFEGHLKDVIADKPSATPTQNTNPLLPTKNRLASWDPDFKGSALFYELVLDTSGNETFQINPHAMNSTAFDKTKITLGEPSFDYSKVGAVDQTWANWNMFNNLCYQGLYQVPLTNKQTTQIKLSSFPIIGGFLNKFTFGINLGYKVTNSVSIPKFPVQHFLIDCEAYDNYVTSLYSTGDLTNLGLLPLDIFRSDSADSLTALIGVNSCVTAFAFNLTDKVSIKPSLTNSADPNKPDLGADEIISFRELGQISQDNTKAYLTNESCHLVAKPLEIQGYVISAFQSQAFAKANYKLTFYSLIGDYDGYIQDDEATYITTCQTMAQFANNTRLWTSNQLFEDMSVELEQPFKYPQQIINPTPQDISSYWLPIGVSQNSATFSATSKSVYSYDQNTGTLVYEVNGGKSNQVLSDFPIPEIAGYSPSKIKYSILCTYTINNYDVQQTITDIASFEWKGGYSDSNIFDSPNNTQITVSNGEIPNQFADFNWYINPPRTFTLTSTTGTNFQTAQFTITGPQIFQLNVEATKTGTNMKLGFGVTFSFNLQSVLGGTPPSTANATIDEKMTFTINDVQILYAKNS